MSTQSQERGRRGEEAEVQMVNDDDEDDDVEAPTSAESITTLI
jgi:hypothetical protein